MDRATIEPAIRSVLTETHSKTERSRADREGAEACALTGSVVRRRHCSMDIEQLIYEVGRLQDAASLLNRLFANSDEFPLFALPFNRPGRVSGST